MPRVFLSCLGLLMIATSVAGAQPNCKKGKPCGNSCIAANRTCRVASSPPSPRPVPSPVGQPLLSRPESAATTRAEAPPAPAVDTLLPWVVSATGATYYASACSGAESIARETRLYFGTEENLKRLGMTRAPAKEERCSLQQLQEHERRVTQRQP